MLYIKFGGRKYAIEPIGRDIAIALRPDRDQPNHFGADPARSEPMRAGAFVGDTRRGGSCNCETLTLTPHCNGTHTECVGHVTDARFGLDQIATGLTGIAALVSITPRHRPARNGETGEDLVITADDLARALATTWHPDATSLVLRTLPNDADKTTRYYDPSAPCPYLTANAAGLLVERKINHLLVDMPSVDRLLDGGRLEAHRIFWGLPPGSRELAAADRPQATITEMIYAPDEIVDGLYYLNLQVPRLALDAAPSRPTLHRLRPER